MVGSTFIEVKFGRDNGTLEDDVLSPALVASKFNV